MIMSRDRIRYSKVYNTQLHCALSTCARPWAVSRLLLLQNQSIISLLDALERMH